MRYRNKIEEFNQRWNIEIGSEEAFVSFRNRLIAILEMQLRSMGDSLEKVEEEFCFARGIRNKDLYFEPLEHTSVIVDEINSSSNLQALVTNLQHILWIINDNRYVDLAHFHAAVQYAIDSSPLINIRLNVDANGAEVYPSGAQLLDNEVINANLSWLSKYPEVYKHYHDSLKTLLQDNPEDYRDVVDKQRYSLELLLKHVLDNNKGLPKQHDELGRWLKDKGIHSSLRMQIQNTIVNLENYNNDWAKHAKKSSHKPSKHEIEFVIYQTGTVMRLLLELDGLQGEET